MAAPASLVRVVRGGIGDAAAGRHRLSEPDRCAKAGRRGAKKRRDLPHRVCQDARRHAARDGRVPASRRRAASRDHAAVALRGPAGARVLRRVERRSWRSGRRTATSALTQDARGTGRSQGTFHPIVQEQADGYDAVEWAAAQPWSTGKVGMLGTQYFGVTQWQAALTAPPHSGRDFAGPDRDRLSRPLDLRERRLRPLVRPELDPELPRAGHASAQAGRNGRVRATRRASQAMSTWRRASSTSSRSGSARLPLTAFAEFRTLAPYYYEWLEHPELRRLLGQGGRRGPVGQDQGSGAHPRRLGRPVRRRTRSAASRGCARAADRRSRAAGRSSSCSPEDTAAPAC